MASITVPSVEQYIGAETERRPFTVGDYALMRIAGVFKDDERVELIDGEIRRMSPIGPIHAEIVDRLTLIFCEQQQGQAQVRVQGPAQLNEYSEPQPDLLLLRKKVGGYGQGNPQPEDVILAVEVSDSSIDFDRKVKMPRYAAAGIPETWIVDIQNQCIEQYLKLESGKYQEKRPRLIDDTIRSTNLPTIEFEVKRLFA